MNTTTKRFILATLKDHRLMTLATNRTDGFPHATTVAFANDGLTLYFACDRASQKVRNIERSKKVSLTVDHDEANWKQIKGLSMGAVAEVLTKKADIARARALLAKRFPGMFESDEDAAETAFVRVRPKVISVIDYTRGFGHTELVRAA